MQTCKNSKMKQSGSNSWIYALLLVLLIPSISRAAGDTVIPEGTRINLQLNDNLSTNLSREGDAFKAIVVNPVYLGEKIVIPKGSVVTGSISRIIRPGRLRGKPVMNLLFQSISIPGRGEYQIAAMLEQVNSDDSSDHPEGTVKGKGSTGKDVIRVLVPTIAGAGIGGLAGGGKSAGIGAGIGAAIGIGTVFSTPGKDLKLSRGSVLDISLEKPLTIPAVSENITEELR
jgi:hypothetical protein